MRAIGIETSCDETAISIVNDDQVLSSVVASQDEVHAPYGGVVPELASRRHMEVISHLLETALVKANSKPADIDGIAVTYAPGLLGSLLVGLQFAKGLSLAWDKPLIGVNHLEGHLNAINLVQKPKYPHLALVVSGGHTSLYLTRDFGDYKRLGETIDDAAGEAFDKVAKLLGLGYPGGPRIAKKAEEGNPKAFKFTYPNIKNKKIAFSFSGIKTKVMQIVRKQNELSNQFKADMSASFQEAAVDFLIRPIIFAAEEYQIKSVVIGGGVAANKRLREKMSEEINNIGGELLIPPMEYCTDNAAMIAYVGMKKLQNNETSNLSLNAVANMEIG